MFIITHHSNRFDFTLCSNQILENRTNKRFHFVYVVDSGPDMFYTPFQVLRLSSASAARQGDEKWPRGGAQREQAQLTQSGGWCCFALFSRKCRILQAVCLISSPRSLPLRAALRQYRRLAPICPVFVCFYHPLSHSVVLITSVICTPCPLVLSIILFGLKCCFLRG